MVQLLCLNTRADERNVQATAENTKKKICGRHFIPLHHLNAKISIAFQQSINLIVQKNRHVDDRQKNDFSYLIQP